LAAIAGVTRILPGRQQELVVGQEQANGRFQFRELLGKAERQDRQMNVRTVRLCPST
jgi:hypothetical protein